MTPFKLDERLARDSVFVADLSLCRLLLMNEARYPWFILVPRIANARELIDLNPEQEMQLLRESRLLQRYLLDELKAQKLNVAALGNMVPQLHIHHIARFKTDAAWPAPVWGKFTAEAYQSETANNLLKSVKTFFEGDTL